MNAGHPDVEVRLNALKELTSILRNNIMFEAQKSAENSWTNEDQVINLDELTRQLIRWFQYKPITNSDDVLDLLTLILGVSQRICRVIE